MALPLDVRHDREIEGISGGIFKSADSALAEDHLAVALGKDVFGRHEEVFHGRAHAAFQENRDPGPAAFLEQVEVLHVPAPILEDVGISFDVLLDLAGFMTSATTVTPAEAVVGWRGGSRAHPAEALGSCYWQDAA